MTRQTTIRIIILGAMVAGLNLAGCGGGGGGGGGDNENAPPVAGSVAVSPAAPTTTDELSAQVSGFSDPEGQPLTYSYAWTRNGSPLASQTADRLPADQTQKRDQITVTVTASDDVNSVAVTSAPVTISNSPPTLSVCLPKAVVYDQPMSLVVKAVDPDDDPITLSLTSGPEGMVLNEGVLSWTLPDMLAGQQVPLSLTAQTGDAATNYADSLTVASSNRMQPLVRTGIHTPRNIEIQDFDGDGKHEILVLADYNRLYTLVFDGNQYIQDWVYPFSLISVPDYENIQTIATIVVAVPGVNSQKSDSGDSIVKSLIRIYDGKSFNQKTEFTLKGWVDDLTLAPAGGNPRYLLVAISEGGPYYQSTIVTIDSVTGKELWRSPGLLGAVQSNSMSFADTNGDGEMELLVGTEDAMYVNMPVYPPVNSKCH